jgi:hypothetical protein
MYLCPQLVLVEIAIALIVFAVTRVTMHYREEGLLRGI